MNLEEKKTSKSSLLLSIHYGNQDGEGWLREKEKEVEMEGGV